MGSGRAPERSPKRHFDRHSLPIREALQRTKHRPEQLLETRKRQLHLALHAGCQRHHTPGRSLDQVLEQHRLAESLLTTHHQHPAAPRAHTHEHAVQRLLLATAPPQRPSSALEWPPDGRITAVHDDVLSRRSEVDS